MVYEQISSNLDIKYLLLILNSKLIKYEMNADRRSNIHIYPDDWRKIKIVSISLEIQKPYIEKTDLMISLNKELQEVSQKFQRTIQREFELDKLPKKLQDWYLLSYGDFIKELVKKKVKLSLSQKGEWEDYFLEESKKALELKSNIEITDKEIDAMVYDLYGLNEEEIEIVENS